MIVKRPIAPEKVFEHAQCFYRTWVAVSGAVPGSPSQRESERVHAALTLAEPIIVLGALTTELFLKCLICVESGDAPQWHNLKALFGKVSAPTRARIEGLWNSEVVVRRYGTWDAWEKLGLKVGRDLATALAEGATAFERYRYSYEDNTEVVHFYLEDLSAILERVILEMRPEFDAWRRAPLVLQMASHH